MARPAPHVVLVLAVTLLIAATGVADRSLDVAPQEPDDAVLLPGLRSKAFGGYMNLSTSGRLFYTYVESESKPLTDPVILWLEGGPGCSGIGTGLMSGGYGPFAAALPNGTLLRNPWSWTTVANVIYLDQPLFTGFSTSSNPDDRRTNDTKTIANLVSFLIGFYRRHPGMRANKLFLIGVSYGGHYATLLARAILQYNKMYAVAKQLPLAGVSVQNAWMDPYYDNRGSVEAWYGAGLIERATRDGLLACDLANGVLWRTEGANNLTKPCAALRDRAYKEAGEGVELYGLNLPVCINNASATYPVWPQSYGLALSSPCDDATEALNSAALQVALRAIRPGEEAREWKFCAGRGIQYAVASLTTSMLPSLRALLTAGIPVLVVNGDSDTYISPLSTRGWIESLQLPLTRSIRTWTDQVTGQTAGHVLEYQGGLIWVTVRWAGHHIAASAPAKSLQLVKAFISNQLSQLA